MAITKYIAKFFFSKKLEVFLIRVLMGLSIFFFASPMRELLGLVMLLFVAMYLFIKKIKTFSYASAFILVALISILLLIKSAPPDKLTTLILSSCSFVIGYYFFISEKNHKNIFIFIFLLPLVTHLLIGSSQILAHLFTFKASSLQHLFLTAKLSLSIGVKNFGFILNFIIPILIFLISEKKGEAYKVFLILSLLALAMIDNRSALIILIFSATFFLYLNNFLLKYKWLFNPKILTLLLLNISLLCYVYSARGFLFIDSVVAAINYAYYSPWPDTDKFYDKFCHPLNGCSIDESVFYRVSLLIHAIDILFNESSFFSSQGNTIHDFHSEVINWAIPFGIFGFLITIFLLLYLLRALKSHQIYYKSTKFYQLHLVLFFAIICRILSETLGGYGLHIFLSLYLANFLSAKKHSRIGHK